MARQITLFCLEYGEVYDILAVGAFSFFALPSFYIVRCFLNNWNCMLALVHMTGIGDEVVVYSIHLEIHAQEGVVNGNCMMLVVDIQGAVEVYLFHLLIYFQKCAVTDV